MKQTIYIDILICINLFINYFILLSVAHFLKVPAKKKRLILGALLGAVYSLSILLPRLSGAVSLLLKILISVAIVLVAFGRVSARSAVKLVVCFYLMSFAFCGTIFGLWYFLALKGIFIHNGIVYFDISPLLLLGTTVVSYFVVLLFNRIVGREVPGELFCRVEIELDKKVAQINAKIDTGHTLKEPFSGLPVIVVEFRAIKDLLGEEIRPFFADYNKKTTLREPSPSWPHQYRLIPFQVISGQGLLPSFLPDRVSIFSKQKKINRNAFVAVCASGVLNNEFSALVSPELACNE